MEYIRYIKRDFMICTGSVSRRLRKTGHVSDVGNQTHTRVLLKISKEVTKIEKLAVCENGKIKL